MSEQRKQRKTGVKARDALWWATMLIVAAFCQASSPPSVARTARIKEWLAFGSGCRSSSQSPQSDFVVETIFSDRIRTLLKVKRFELELPHGGKSVRECAFRMVVSPPPDLRVKHIQARTRLLANKTPDDHLRGRLLLLLGDFVVDQKTWDLEKTDFARYRDEFITLVAGAKKEFAPPTPECGKEQIVGLDFTFEGVSEAQLLQKKNAPKEKAFLRVHTDTDTEIEISTEECGQRTQKRSDNQEGR
jgi:hypothetical protein